MSYQPSLKTALVHFSFWHIWQKKLVSGHSWWIHLWQQSHPESSPRTELRISAFKAPLISDSTLTSNQFTVFNRKVVSMMNSELSPNFCSSLAWVTLAALIKPVSSSIRQELSVNLDFHSSDGQKHKSKWMIIYHG